MKYLVEKSQRLHHESQWKDSNHHLTMRELWAEVGCYVMTGYEVINASIDHCKLEQIMHPSDPVSPRIILFTVKGEVKS